MSASAGQAVTASTRRVPAKSNPGTRNDQQRPAPPRSRPTHFLAIPLYTSPLLRTRMSTFNSHLLSAHDRQPSGNTEGAVRGLHPSIVINPMRFHLTLGVMALDDDDTSLPAASNTNPVHPGIESKSNPNVNPGGGDITTAEPTADAVQRGIGSKNNKKGKGNQKGKQEPGPVHTITEALALLRSLKPQLDAILDPGPSSALAPGSGIGAAGAAAGSACVPIDNDISNVRAPVLGALGGGPPAVPAPLTVVLDHVDIMRPVKPPQLQRQKKQNPQPVGTAGGVRQGIPPPSSAPVLQTKERADDALHNTEGIWADVMYLAPRESGTEGRRLRRLCDLIHKTFKGAGYITETRPLKLHCTILNTSHRRPRQFGVPFSYSDVLRSGALKTIAHTHPEPQGRKPSDQVPLSVPLNAGAVATSNRGGVGGEKAWTTVHVQEVGLWVMGSHAKNGAYVSVGGVKLG